MARLFFQYLAIALNLPNCIKHSKVGSRFWRILNKPSKYCPRPYLFCQRCHNTLPNLVTLTLDGHDREHDGTHSAAVGQHRNRTWNFFLLTWSRRGQVVVAGAGVVVAVVEVCFRNATQVGVEVWLFLLAREELPFRGTAHSLTKRRNCSFAYGKYSSGVEMRAGSYGYAQRCLPSLSHTHFLTYSVLLSLFCCDCLFVFLSLSLSLSLSHLVSFTFSQLLWLFVCL